MVTEISPQSGDKPAFWADAIDHLRRVDPALRPWLDGSDIHPPQPRATAFEALSRAIVGQQISTHAARAIISRVVSRCEGFSPACIQSLGPAELRQIGLSKRKAEYLLDLSLNADQLQLTPWESMPDGAIRARLTALRGIGPWTADMFLIFQLRRADVLPLGDGGIIRALRKLSGQTSSSLDDLKKRADPWRPYRSVASLYLWRMLDCSP